MSEPEPRAGEPRRRRPPPEWVEETGDSVFSQPANPGGRGRPPTHDGRTVPDPYGDWDHPTRPGADAQRTRIDGYAAPGGGQAWDQPAPGGYGGRGRAQPGYPNAGPPPTARYDRGPAGYPGGGPSPGGYPDQGWGAQPPGGPMRPRDTRRAPDDPWGGGRYGDGADRGRERGRDREGAGLGFPFGLGTLVGVAGLVAVLLSLMSLPWFTVAGQDVALKDIRTAFDLPETDPGDVVPGAGEGTGATVPSSIPTPGDVSDAVEQEVRNAAGELAAGFVDSGKGRYLELYAETLWMAVAGACAFAVVFATILSPRSFALSLILGFRRLSGALVVLAGIAHGAALWVVFSGDGPTPATGVWVGVGGLVAVLVATILGPKRS